MQADWEFEVGNDEAGYAAPIIDARWPGFVDLRLKPELAWNLPETVQFPALAEALIRLNEEASPVWTSKCDFWSRLEDDEFDPDDLDAQPGFSVHAMGCYIDLLPMDGQRWLPPDQAEAVCKRWCKFLRALTLTCCRVDLVIRRAFIHVETLDLGITAYITSCGESSTGAAKALEAALMAFSDAARCV